MHPRYDHRHIRCVRRFQRWPQHPILVTYWEIWYPILLGRFLYIVAVILSMGLCWFDDADMG